MVLSFVDNFDNIKLPVDNFRGGQMDNKQIWKAVLGELEVVLSKANFTTWFKDTSILSSEDGVFVISVPNGFTKEWLQNKYQDKIISALKKIIPEVKEIKYQIGSLQVLETLNNSVLRETSVFALSQETPLKGENGQLNSKYTFSNFVVGNSNKLAFASCQAVAKAPGKTYNPLFIYGGVGLGKTHLMQAIGNEILKQHPRKKVMYVACERFVNEFIQAISTRKTNKFKNTYRNVDVLLIDDIQFLAGKEGTQEEFFHTFNSLHQTNKQIVISSDRPPKAIPTLEERLRSRFEWGMITDIQTPDLETRMAILESKCKEKNYKIQSEVLNFIAKNIQYNIRELEGALNRIIAYCELNNLEPTLNTVTKTLEIIVAPHKKRNVSCDQIIQAVASFYNTEVNDVLGKKRNKELVLPRQVSMYLMREEINQSYPKIAEVLGGKDHTTIIHGYKKIKNQLGEDENLYRDLNLIKEKLYS